MIPALPCHVFLDVAIAISHSTRLKCLKKTKIKPKTTYCYLFTALCIQVHAACWMFQLPLDNQQTAGPLIVQPPSNKQQEFTHTHLSEKLFKNFCLLFITCLTIAASPSKNGCQSFQSKELKYCWNERAMEKNPRATRECWVTWEAGYRKMRGNPWCCHTVDGSEIRLSPVER